MWEKTPNCLELTWLQSFKSIHSIEECKKLIIEGFKGCIAVKLCNFMNQNTSSFYNICLYPLCHYSHLTDDYQKLVLICCESHPNNIVAVSISRYSILAILPSPVQCFFKMLHIKRPVSVQLCQLIHFYLKCRPSLDYFSRCSLT